MTDLSIGEKDLISRGPRALHNHPLSSMSGRMSRESLSTPTRVLFVALLLTAGLADESEDIALKPVDLKKDGFDVTLQALPSGESLQRPPNVSSHSHFTILQMHCMGS